MCLLLDGDNRNGCFWSCSNGNDNNLERRVTERKWWLQTEQWNWSIRWTEKGNKSESIWKETSDLNKEAREREADLKGTTRRAWETKFNFSTTSSQPLDVPAKFTDMQKFNSRATLTVSLYWLSVSYVMLNHKVALGIFEKNGENKKSEWEGDVMH